MRYTLLIALREFAENAKTKGFWIGIFTLPVLLAISIGVSTKLAQLRTIAVLRRRRQIRRVRRTHRPVHRVGAPALRAPGAGAGTSRKTCAPGSSPERQPRYLPGCRRCLHRGRRQGRLSQRSSGPCFEKTRLRSRSRRACSCASSCPSDIDADASSDAILAELKPYLLGDRRIAAGGGEAPLFAAVLIAPDAVDGAMRWTGTEAIQYWSTNLAVNDLPERIRNALNRETRRRLYVARGVDVATVRGNRGDVRPPRHVRSRQSRRARRPSAPRTASRATCRSAFVYLLWMSIFTVMQMLLNNTLEEKSNRIAEVLLSSVTPNEIMMGKLLGIAGIGLTMVGAWLATVFIAAQLYQGRAVPRSSGRRSTPWSRRVSSRCSCCASCSAI